MTRRALPDLSVWHELHPRRTRQIVVQSLVVSLAALAALGWERGSVVAAPTISIIDVRPLTTNDLDLRDMLGHHLAVHVATRHWHLEPARSETSGLDPRPRLRRWRLYIDGYPLSDSFTDVAFTPFLPPGDHWLIAELRRPDHTSLRHQVWSQPVLVHVPRVFGQPRRGRLPVTPNSAGARE